MSGAGTRKTGAVSRFDSWNWTPSEDTVGLIVNAHTALAF